MKNKKFLKIRYRNYVSVAKVLQKNTFLKIEKNANET